jgi:transposase
LPLVTTVVRGDCADDPLYVPAMQQVRSAVCRAGLLYVGDCKMAALATRAFVAASGDHYLCPLSEKQVSPEALAILLAPIWAGDEEPTLVTRPAAAGGQEVLGQGFAVCVPVTGAVDGREHSWEERRLVFRSWALTESKIAALRGRLGKALTALTALTKPTRGRKRPQDRAAWEAEVEKIVRRYDVVGLVQVDYTETEHQRTIRGRGAKPTRTEVVRQITASIQGNAAAVQQAERALGWRVYATNAPLARLSLTEALLTYRSQVLIERGFGRLKGRPLSLEPMYLLRDDHATGLVRLLSLALRQLSLIEFQVRRGLAQTGEQLTGIYPGNPGAPRPRCCSEPSHRLPSR